jgi:PAS domain S-box-containing protein
VAGEAFAALLAVLPEAALLLHPDSAIQFANRPAAEMLAGVRTIPAGRRLADFADGSAPALELFLRSCARSGQFIPGALDIIDASGRRRALRLEGALVEPRTPERAALLVVRLLPKEAAVNRFATLNLRIGELNKEIARRHQVERTLRNERELLEVTLASIGDAVIATDPDGRISFMNAVAASQTGWDPAQAIGRPLHEVFVIVNESTRLAVENPVERVLREKKVVGLANHTVLIRRDGQSHPIDDAGAPILDPHGHVLGVVLVFRDITERRTAERERARSERRKDEFLAMLAHELRNPLAAIAAGVEVVRRGQSREAIAEVSAGMHRQVRHLARLVDDLLDVSRIATGKITLKRRPVALDTIVEDALAAHQPAIAGRSIAVSWQPAPRPPQVYGDAERLAQVVGNLVSNAVKFNRAGGSVRIATGIEDGWAFVQVSDSGEGIAAEILPEIFELFVQGDTSPERARGGLGVGLTIAKLVSEQHGGRIEAKSGGVGQGAEFTVRLPLHGEAQAAPASPPESRPPRSRARRILVVDDNADVATSIAMLLTVSGHEVRVAHDGPTALRLHGESSAEVVLLDLGMAGMDGFEVARRLRERGHAPRIYALSGYGTEADRARASAAGFDGHLTKPVDIDTLETLLRGL